jgi:pantoate--beta-alanine ligase
MIRDLGLPVRLDVAPTVRERDGLAFSTRNQYLSAVERRAAPVLYRALRRGAECIGNGETGADRIVLEMLEVLKSEPLAKPQYVEIVDAESLEPVGEVEGQVLLAMAVFIGRARLIDNLVVRIPKPRGGKRR